MAKSMTHEEQNQQLRQLLQDAMPAVASAWLQSRGEKFADTFLAIKQALSQQADECIQGSDSPMETEAHKRTRCLWDLRQIVSYLDNNEDCTIASGSVFHHQMRMAYEALSVEPKPLAYIRSKDLDRLAPEQVVGCTASLRKQAGKGWIAIHAAPEAIPEFPEII